MNAIRAIVVVLPLLVTLVICGVARREGVPLPVPRLLALIAMTLLGAGASLLLPQLIVSVTTFAVLFVSLAVPVMRALEQSAREQLHQDEIRTASLLPRHLGTYVPLWIRLTGVAFVLALLAWVVLRAATSSSPVFMLCGFAIAALTFFGLYESWMRQEVFSVRARDEDDRQRRVRAVFAAQIFLALVFLLMAGLSVGSWPGLPALGVTAAIIGGTGCAFALSTAIQERYLRAWSVRRDQAKKTTI